MLQQVTMLIRVGTLKYATGKVVVLFTNNTLHWYHLNQLVEIIMFKTLFWN